jgi:hypothetical protein
VQNWKNIKITNLIVMAGEGIKIYGFFLVGEMVGKGSIIGYQVSKMAY